MSRLEGGSIIIRVFQALKGLFVFCPLRRVVRGLVILLPVLGITWAIGLFRLAGLGIGFEYAFTVLNSTQVSKACTVTSVRHYSKMSQSDCFCQRDTSLRQTAQLVQTKLVLFFDDRALTIRRTVMFCFVTHLSLCTVPLGRMEDACLP